MVCALCLLGASVALAQESQDTPAAKAAFEKGEELRRQSKFVEAAAEYRKAIELDADYAEAHSMFIFTSKIGGRNGATDSAAIKAADAATGEQLKAIYAEWIARDPKRAAYQWAMGDIHMYKDYVKVEQNMRKAIQLDPKFAKAWQTLSLVAEVSGDNAKEREYLKKAAAAAPDNRAYAFYYANSLKNASKTRYVKAALDVAKRFPAHERGGQSLY
jgi:Tfp pilus assembly protein PilF